MGYQQDGKALLDLTLQRGISMGPGLQWCLWLVHIEQCPCTGSTSRMGWLPQQLGWAGLLAPSGFAMPSLADTLGRAWSLNQLCSLSGLLQAHPNSRQIRSCKSTLLSLHYFPDLEVQGRLILILPEIAAHELGRNRSNLSAEFRLCHVSDCSLPSQCKTLFPFTSHHFFLQNAFSADNAHGGTMQAVVWEKKPVFF